MKKLMFGALACVAFAFSGFASNETIEFQNSLDLKLEKEFIVEGTKCYFRVCIADSKGNKTCTPWTEISCSTTDFTATVEQTTKIEAPTKGNSGML